MVGKTAPIRPEDRVRMDTIKKHCGCLPCLLRGIADVHTTIEHVTESGRRLDDEHQATIGLCEWHHLGVGSLKMAESVGPSLAYGRHAFEEAFGDEVRVMLPTQNYMLYLFGRDPWPEYNVPRYVQRLTRKQWATLRNAQSST